MLEIIISHMGYKIKSIDFDRDLVLGRIADEEVQALERWYMDQGLHDQYNFYSVRVIGDEVLLPAFHFHMERRHGALKFLGDHAVYSPLVDAPSDLVYRERARRVWWQLGRQIVRSEAVPVQVGQSYGLVPCTKKVLNRVNFDRGRFSLHIREKASLSH